MGWLVGWNSRNEVITSLKDWSVNHEILDTGNTREAYYLLVRNKQTQEQFIAVALIKKFPKGTGVRGGEWGYKLMDETMGPYVADCPLKLLGRSTIADPTAVSWRQSCREYHKKQTRRRRYIKQLKTDDVVIVQGSAYVVQSASSRGWRAKCHGFIVTSCDNGTQYFVRNSQIELRPTA